MPNIESLSLDNQSQKTIELIEKVYKSVDSNGFEENIGSIAIIVSIIIRYFPEDTERKTKLIKIKNDLSFSKSLNSKESRYENCIESYKVLLKYLIQELEILGFPRRIDVKLDNSINVENHNYLSQRQSISIELLKNSFTDSQLESLRAIIKNDKDKEAFKTKILQKLKDFGSDVSSNILASLITNPEIWNRLI